LVAQLAKGLLYGLIQVGARTPYDVSPDSLGPLGHPVVVAAHGDMHATLSLHNVGCHLLGKRGPLMRLESITQSDLGLFERFHRNQDSAPVRNWRSHELSTLGRSAWRSGAYVAHRVALMDMGVCVLGGGSWGTTVASLAAGNAPTVLWCRDELTAESINERHVNPRYLEGYELHPSLTATNDLAAAVGGADLIVVGVPSQGFRSTLEVAAPHVRPSVPIVSLTKGLEHGTRLRMSQVITDVLPGHRTGALTGPNLAKEVLAGGAAASVVAMADQVVATALQQVFSTELFRVYINDDVIGCELGGALKNVIALASGMADGLGTGDNTRAAVITRGLAEMSRLGVALGGRAETFAGLTGMGDLVATCISPQSRNRYFGEQLGRGNTVEEIAAEMDQVAEGVKAAPVIVSLADEVGVPVPIAREVLGVITGAHTAEQAYRGLLGRSLTTESEAST